MDLNDAELLARLTARDGPLPAGSLPHAAGGSCRFRDAYPEGECPWCRAAGRRRERQTLPAEGAADSAGAGV